MVYKSIIVINIFVLLNKVSYQKMEMLRCCKWPRSTTYSENGARVNQLQVITRASQMR